MAGDRPPLVGRHFGDLFLHPGVEFDQAAIEGLGAVAIVGGVRRIGFGESLGDVRDIGTDTLDVLPAMRVGPVPVGMAVRVSAAGRRGTGRDAGRRHDRLALEGCRLGEAVDPALEAQPVAHQHFRSGERARVAGARLIGMGVDVGTDHDRQLGLVAGHLGQQVAQDREGRHGLDGSLRRGRQGNGEQAQGQKKRTEDHFVII